MLASHRASCCAAQIIARFYKEKGFKPHNKEDKFEPRRDEILAQFHDFPAFVGAVANRLPHAHTHTHTPQAH